MGDNILPSEAEIRAAFEGTNFGPGADPATLVRNGVLKVALGFHNGATLAGILEHLGLTTVRTRRGVQMVTLTLCGRLACWQWLQLPRPTDREEGQGEVPSPGL